MPTRYSSSSSACTARPSTPAPASVWPWPRRSSSSTRAASCSPTPRGRNTFQVAPPALRSHEKHRRCWLKPSARSRSCSSKTTRATMLMARESLPQGEGVQPPRVVGDGVEAVSYLRRCGNYAEAVRPDLVLLDLNLPKRDGRQVLEDIKSDPDLRRIPIVVLTTSEAEEDVLRSYDLPRQRLRDEAVDFERFVEVIRRIDEFLHLGGAPARVVTRAGTAGRSASAKRLKSMGRLARASCAAVDGTADDEPEWPGTGQHSDCRVRLVMLPSAAGSWWCRAGPARRRPWRCWCTARCRCCRRRR